MLNNVFKFSHLKENFGKLLFIYLFIYIFPLGGGGGGKQIFTIGEFMYINPSVTIHC